MVTLGVPRTLITPHLMGRTMGPVGDTDRQWQVVSAALELLTTATEPGTLVRMESPPGPAAP